MRIGRAVRAWRWPAFVRLKRWNPGLVVWGLSATLGNLGEAMHTLVGDEQGCLVQGRVDKPLVIDTLLPHEPGRFSWGGHLGAQMLLPVVEEIEDSPGTITPGRSLDECRRNLRDSRELMVETHRDEARQGLDPSCIQEAIEIDVLEPPGMAATGRHHHMA